MAEAKIMLFDSPSKQRKDGTFPVVLKITHQRKRKYIALGRHCLPKQWSKEAGRFTKAFPKYKAHNDVLLKLQTKASDIIRIFERDEISFSFHAFEQKFLDLETSKLLVDYFQHWIDKFMKEGKIGTASPYKTTLNAIIHFSPTISLSSNELRLQEINYKFLIDFEHWLRTERNCKDTSISVYMRTLRAVLNKAIREKIIKREHYPFDEYRLSERLKTETPKRAIDKESVKQLELLELEQGSKLHFARDIFLFSYYTRGMNFVDIAYLTPENFGKDRLHYVRRKTGKPFNIGILPQVQMILNFYIQHKIHSGPYIFPVFDDAIHISAKQQYDRRKTALREVNRNLKKLALMIGLENLRLTSYVSRHTYATVLKRAGTNVSQISEALGHQSEKVTQIYLKQFENTELDQVDAEVL